MSGQLPMLAGALAGVAMLVLVAAALGLGRGAAIADEAEARELADNAICGFEASEIALDRHGRGALLSDAAGRVMLLKPHGAQFAAMLIEGSPGANCDDGRLTLAGTTLDLGDSAWAWAERLQRLDS